MFQYQANHANFAIHKGTALNFIPHLHQEIELLYIKKGSMLVTLQHTTFTVTESDLILIMPHVIHELSTPNYCEHIMLIFNPDLIGHYLPYFQKSCTSPIINTRSFSSEIPMYLEQLLLHKETTDIGMIKGYLYLIFANLLPSLEFIKKDYSKHQLTLCDCLDYMHLHFKEPLTITTLAEATHITPTYISHLFKKSLGYGFNHYLNMLRIDYAKYLLQETTHSITEICYMSGYETLRHFNRVFKEFTSCTPQEYRKKL